MQETMVGVREAKAHLSQLLRRVQGGEAIVITDRGKPVGKLVPVSQDIRPLGERLKRLERLGWVESATEDSSSQLPLPLPVAGERAQRVLEQDRTDGWE